MPKTGNRPARIIANLREAYVLLGNGNRVAEAVKALGVMDVTCTRCRQSDGHITVR